MNGSVPDQGPLEKPLDPCVAEYSVTELTRRETCGSICRLLLEDMVKTQAGSSKWQTGIPRARQKSTLVNGRGLRSANNIQRARQRDNPGNRQKVRNQTTRQHRMTKQKL